MNTAWTRVCGEQGSSIEELLSSRVGQRQAKGSYSAEDVKYIAALNLKAVKGDLKVSDEVLEKMRRLCQIWDVDLKAKPISSHRKFVGPVIVAAKKMMFPIIRIFLKDFLRQQRQFNAGCISLLAEIAQSAGKSECKENPERD